MKLERIEEGKRLLSRLIFLLIGVVMAVSLYGYKLQVDGFDVDARDLSARTEPRYDLNERMCALIKIELPEGAKFEGNVVDFKHDVNEYWVYVSPGTKFLNIKYPDFETLSLSFPELGVAEGLDGGMTYRLSLSGYRDNGVSVPQGRIYTTLNITYRPIGSEVLLDGKSVGTTPLVLNDVTAADHTVTIRKAGYQTVTKDIVLKANQTEEMTGELTVNFDQKVEEIVSAYDKKEYAKAYDLAMSISDNPIAQNYLGLMFENGKGVNRDYGEALKWYHNGAEGGNTDAMYNLGDMYYEGKGVKQDYAEAEKWYRKVAEGGDFSAMEKLGDRYYEGKGVKQDYAEAEKWYRKVAEGGDFSAMKKLGDMYYEGKGVKQDYAEAFRWYRKAAENGDEDAMFSLGYMYDEGLGVKQDYTEAVKWYHKAAEGRNIYAIYNLAYMYENGYGVTQDYTEALRWYRIASDKGYLSAKEDVKRLEDKGVK